jgi:aspartate/methionine/tyrosine aminotransferase
MPTRTRERFAARIGGDLEPNALARALAARRAAGRPLLDLTASNPTRAGFDYPEAEILTALASPAALHYEPASRGLAAAREAIAGYYAAHGERVASDDLLLTASTSEGYSLVFKLLAAPGDEILVPAPSYPLFEMLAALEGVELVRYPLAYAAGRGWRIDRDALERALGPRTRAIVVVHPNNPTGSFAVEEERAWLEDLCARRALALIADEVFLDYASDGRVAPSFCATRDALAFVLSGLSKVAGLPQMKLGWIAVAGPRDARREAGQGLELIADAYLSVGGPVQHAAAALLALRGGVQRQIRERVAANERWLRARCAKTRGVRVLEREAGWYAVLELPEDVAEEALCVRLVEAHGVLVHPGFFFDFERSGVLVVSLLVPPEPLAQGIERVLEAI